MKDFVRDNLMLPVIYVDCDLFDTPETFTKELRKQIFYSLTDSSHGLLACDVFDIQRKLENKQPVFEHINQIREGEGYDSNLKARYNEYYYGADEYLAIYFEYMSSTVAQKDIGGLFYVLNVISQRHPLKRPVLMLNSFQSLHQTENGKELASAIVSSFKVPPLKRQLRFPFLIEMSDTFVFSQMYKKHERDFQYREIKPLKREDLYDGLSAKLNMHEVNYVYSYLGGIGMKWSTFWLLYLDDMGNSGSLDRCVRKASVSVEYNEFLELVQNSEYCNQHFHLMKLFAQEQWVLDDYIIEKKNVPRQLINLEMQNNIVYYDGYNYFPQNKVIERRMKQSSDMDESAIAYYCGADNQIFQVQVDSDGTQPFLPNVQEYP